MKWTAGRGGGDARHLALKEHVIAGALDLRVRHRYRIEKNARVGMERFAVEVVARRDLDDASEIHHCDPIAHVSDDAEVVRDEQIGQAELLLEVGKQVQNLGLH